MKKMKSPLPHKYAKPLSLYPLKAEEALAAFMQVDPKTIKKEGKGKRKKKD